jgi:hypothetical protein
VLQAFSPVICGICREKLIALLSPNGRAEMPEPHTIDSVTAHDRQFQGHDREKKFVDPLRSAMGLVL